MLNDSHDVSRVLVEGSPGVLTGATALCTLANGWVKVAIDGDPRVRAMPPNRVIDPSRVVDVADERCDECGQPEHGGECDPGWVDSNEALGLGAGAGSY